nr:uncharacterized protein CTRU02_15238 [Colletotrichum truncatum]KAF6781285.1 hypothetical protein CTRU02_15238 [Colletotrichum truncatum]
MSDGSPDCSKDETLANNEPNKTQVTLLGNNRLERWTPRLNDELVLEITPNESHFGISESPYQSEEPDQIEDDYVDATLQDVVSIDDTSSEEDQERQDRIRHLTEILQYQEIDPYDDNQQLYFFGIPAKKRKTYFESSIQANDHPILDPRAKKHYDLFWGQCIIDSCKLHVVNKHEYKFYPRR